MTPRRQRFRVRLRRGDGWIVKPEAEEIDGRIAWFTYGWPMDSEDSSIYVGEEAWIVDRAEPWLEGAPVWLASGDLESVDDTP